jgi:hypothetical protein
MIDKRGIGKDVEESGCEVMEVISSHLPRGTEEAIKKPQSR